MANVYDPVEEIKFICQGESILQKWERYHKAEIPKKNPNKMLPFLRTPVTSNPIDYYEMALRVNDITREPKKRLSTTELTIAATMINFFFKNGLHNGIMDKDKKLYDKLLEELIATDAMQPKSWNQVRKNLRDKGLLIPTLGYHTIKIIPYIMKILSHKKLVLVIE